MSFKNLFKQQLLSFFFFFVDPKNGFTVEYFDTYKVLTNLITNQKYALVCCNSTLDDYKTGYHAVVNTPLTNVGVDSQLDSLPFFEVSF